MNRITGWILSETDRCDTFVSIESSKFHHPAYPNGRSQKLRAIPMTGGY